MSYNNRRLKPGFTEPDPQVVDPFDFNLDDLTPTKITRSKAKKMTILQLIEGIVEGMEGSNLAPSSMDAFKALFDELGARLDMTSEQAMWLAFLINMADDSHILAHDVARFLKCKTVKVLAHWDAIEALITKQYVMKNCNPIDNEGVLIPTEVMLALRKNTPYVAPSYKNISIDCWLDRLRSLMCQRNNSVIEYRELVDLLAALKKDNQHLKIVQKLNEYALDEEDEIVLLRTLSNFAADQDEEISYNDICDILKETWNARNHSRAIASGAHILQSAELIENQNEDGRANPHVWHLTDKAKEELLSELEIVPNADPINGLLLAKDLQSKQLYFNAEVTKAYDRLRSLLSKERFAEVQDRLDKRGMRRGFACIFYGAPGTGKTETVYQLAKETGRNIMMVDVPNMRSKWVGDTEKNIKAVFDRYRRYVKQSTLAPILLFNEADAILNKRNEGSTNSVDKMENAMQNIILQEMENLNGIMIATTNLTDNLDKAFERRFLYKMEFPKPTPNERVHIWQSMLPELSEDNAMLLAKKYDFSGGQIENITRKHIVDCILNGEDELNMSTIYDACSSELIRSKNNKHIGFE